MQKLVFRNGAGNEIDLTAGNFGITNWAGLSNTSLNIQTQQVPFEDGGVFLDALMEQREIDVTVAIYDGNNLELRYQKKRELISALNPKLGEGVLIYTNDYLSRQIHAVPQIPLFENKNSNDRGTLKASVTFSCPSPYWEDVEESVVDFRIGEIPTIENNGDIPAQVEIELFTTEAVNPSIKNVTNNKLIKYNGTLNENLLINTNVGKKEIVTESIKVDTIYNSTDIKKIVYARNLSLYIAISRSTISSSWDLNTWIQQSVTTGVLNGIIHNPEYGFLIVGEQGTVITGNDGEKWNVINSGITETLNSVIYSDELNLFVAVGNYGVIITSTDRINWTRRTSGVSEHLYGIACSSTLLVAVGNNGTIITSSDGINWTSRGSGVTKAFYDAIYNSNNNIFVAVGQDDYICYSSDGINWTSTYIGADSALYTIIYNEDSNMFVSAGNTGTGVACVYTSLNGIDWRRKDIISNTTYFFCMIYNKDINGYIGAGSYGSIFKSEDLSVWETKVTGINGLLNSVVYSEEKKLYVTVGFRGVILTSKDRKKWERQTSGVQNFLRDIIYSPELNLFVAVGDNDSVPSCGRIIASSNAKDWTIVKGYEYMSWNYFGIAYSSELNLFVAVGSSGAMSYSTDGINWEQYSRMWTYNSLYEITCVKEKRLFIAVGGNGTIITSSDGMNWTSKTTNITTLISHIIYVDEYDLFVITTGNNIYASVDLENWELQYTNDNLDYIGVIKYSKTLGMYVASGSHILISPNLKDWTVVQTNIENTNDMIYESKTNNFLSVGGAFILSIDSVKETNQIANISNNSELDFNLSLGKNQIVIARDTGNLRSRIKYRQKYIGV